MIPLRSLFASVLLAVVLVGGALAPAVHWASHGMEEHAVQHAEGADDYTGALLVSDAGHASDCPDCAHLQTYHVTGPATQPFYAGVIGLERSAPAPDDPASSTDDLATPEERGPPAAV